MDICAKKWPTITSDLVEDIYLPLYCPPRAKYPLGATEIEVFFGNTKRRVLNATACGRVARSNAAWLKGDERKVERFLTTKLLG